ncbi:MAG: type II toxin-antitoxin system Phd/YefM family antitoxin [Bacteroidota bacterium]
MQTTNHSELRKNLKKNLDLVSDEKEIVIIHRSGQEDVVMVPLSEYNSWMETSHLLSTEANRENLEMSITEAKEGKATTINKGDLWK